MHQFTWRAMGTEFTLYLPDGEREWAAGVAGELFQGLRQVYAAAAKLNLPDEAMRFLNQFRKQPEVDDAITRWRAEPR